MSWYANIQEASKALRRKTKEFLNSNPKGLLEEYTIVKDRNIPRCYVVIKKVLAKDDQPPTPP